MTEQGIATKVDGTAVVVRISMSEGCSSCQSHDGCGIAGREIQAVADDGTIIAVGDPVRLNIDDSVRAAGAVWLLVVPLVLFFTGYLGVSALWPHHDEGFAALAGIGGLVLGLVFAVIVARRGSMSRRPVATRLHD